MYCKHCGKELQNNEACTCQESKNDLKKKNGNKKLIIIGVAVLVILIAVIGLSSSKTETIDLAAYINTQPEISGLNGKALIEMSELFDESALETYLLEGIGTKDSSDIENMSDEEFEALLGEFGEGASECEQAAKDIEITVWKDGTKVQELTELSNGTKIKVEVSSLNPTNKNLDKKFKTGTVEFTVKGLLDGQEINVFDEVGMDVSFVGTDGNGQVILNWDKDAFSELSIEFHVENATDCRNGDEIKVVLDYDNEEWEENGYMPSEEYRTYTVEGLAALLTAIEDISDKQLEEMKATVEATLTNKAENEWRDGISIEGMTYLGSYLLNKKEGGSALGSPNILYLVYQVDVFENFAPDGGEDSHFSYYYCASYENLMLDQNGNLDLETAYFSECWDGFIRDVCMGDSFLLYSVMVDYDGYETLEELVDTCIGNYADQYSYTTTVEMTE